MFGRIRGVVFIDESMSSESDLEMYPSGRNEASMVVGVDKYIKSPLFDFCEDIEEREEQVEDNLIAYQVLREGLVSKGCSFNTSAI